MSAGDISIEVLSTVLDYIQSIKDIDIYNIEILRDINKKLETINNLKDINVGYFFLLENLYFDMKDLLNDLMLYKVNVEEYREEIDNIITNTIELFCKNHQCVSVDVYTNEDNYSNGRNFGTFVIEKMEMK